MTDTTNPSPLNWLTITLPDNVTQILKDKYLTSPGVISKCSDAQLESQGIPLGLVIQIKEVAFSIVNPIPVPSPTPTPITTVIPPTVGESLTATPTPTPMTAIPQTTSIPNVGGGTTVISLTEPTQGERIKQHLAGLASNDMESRNELVALGVQFVVVGPNNLPLYDETLEMRAQLGNKAPETGFWKDQPVVGINDVGMINYRSPVTLDLLQGGVDAQSGTPWGSLGLEGLIKARCIYTNNMTGGASEQVVYDDVRTNGKMTTRANKRLEGFPELRVTYQNEIAPRNHLVGNPARTGVARAPASARRALGNGSSISGNGRIFASSESAPIQNVLVSAFPTTNAMREFAASVGIDALPGVATERSELAFAIATALGRMGKVESTFEYLVRLNSGLQSAVSNARRELGL